MKSVLIVLCFSIVLLGHAQEPKIYGCNAHFSKKVQDAHKQLLFNISELAGIKEEIYQNLVELYGVKSSNHHRRKFSKIIHCINKKIQKSSFSYKCATGNPCSRYKAYIRKADKPLNHFLGAGSVKLCPNQFILSSEDYIASVIVHEVSHLCLAKDHSYFSGLDQEEMRASNWTTNADSYRNIYYYRDLLD